jgi:hypothetical protein
LVELHELLNSLARIATGSRAHLAQPLFGGKDVRLSLCVPTPTRQAGAVPALSPRGVIFIKIIEVRMTRSERAASDRQAFS